MLEKPDIEELKIENCLKEQYGLDVAELNFLPLGNDVNSAAYRVITQNELSFYLKMRRGDFSKAIAVIPKLLHDNGGQQVIAPIPTKDKKLWVSLNAFNLTLYPFIEGENGFDVPLTDSQWVELGTILRQLHNVEVPSSLKEDLPVEIYSPKWRETAKVFLDRIEHETFDEPTAAKFAEFIKTKKEIINHLIEHAEELAQKLKDENLDFVLCHGDIHAANVLINGNGKFYVVDWDTLILAPKERDLMFIGGGIGGAWNKPEEDRLFYQGYGQVKINQTALAYYRHERIVEDVVEFCSRILDSDNGGRDRDVWLRKFTNAFLPNNVVEIAMED